MKIDPQIDALYQLPLDQFTEKRNALAKELAGTARKQIKFLPKPPLPIWAINQLYWNDRATYSALIDASEKLRAAHKAALSGHKADIRKAEELHRAALEKAFAKTLALLGQSHGSASDAARDTIRQALGALPNDEAPGRLTREPEPAGFSLLTGIKPRVVKQEHEDKKPSTRAQPSRGDARATAARMRAERLRVEKEKRARAKEIVEAERALRVARKAAEQATFQVKKLATELQRAQSTEKQAAETAALAAQKLQRLQTDQ